MRPTADVVLVNMPFGNLLMPSIALGLLKAAIAPTGASSRTFYFTIPFAEQIGVALYLKIAVGEPAIPDLAGEWIFSGSLFTEQSVDEVDRYIEEVLRGHARGHSKTNDDQEPITEAFIENILWARSKAEPFLEACLERVIDCRPRIVGFTSSFQQQVASLCLAKRLKAELQDTFIVFGGANCEGPMGKEVVRQFPFVDAVVSGEGDSIFPEIVRRIMKEQPVSGLRGVFCPGDSRFQLLNEPLQNAPIVENMDSLPIPEFDEYFEQLRRSSLGEGLQPRLLFETSRGCWWGEKHHCTFCGLNGQTMAHRSKTAYRALNELDHLTNRYPGNPVSVVDNILDMRYFKDFIPMLAERKLGVELFYEVKANLRKEHIQLLRDAGITSIQPGIESLSDSVLELMRKGVSALQNIQVLKWCKEFGIRSEWNLLWGFPGEPPDEYHRMADLIPLLTHLTPPRYATSMRLDRFSPNFYESQHLGLKNLSPYPSYAYVYPFAAQAIANLAYFFTFEYETNQDVQSYVKPLAKQIATWQEVHDKSDLFYVDKTTFLLICDFRPAAIRPLIVLTERERFFYMACDEIRTARQILELWNSQFKEPITVATIRDALEEFTAKRIMVKKDVSYLSLAPQRSLAPE